jgi:secondary thiamine-phosphate synthase enzyme
MLTHQVRWSETTERALDFVDITDGVQSALNRCGIDNGQITVFAPAPACSLVVNERESGLFEDVRVAITRLSDDAEHDRRTLLGSSSVVLPAVDGRLRLGIWQRVLLVELEAPKAREIVVQIVGE